MIQQIFPARFSGEEAWGITDDASSGGRGLNCAKFGEDIGQSSMRTKLFKRLQISYYVSKRGWVKGEWDRNWNSNFALCDPLSAIIIDFDQEWILIIQRAGTHKAPAKFQRNRAYTIQFFYGRL